MFRLGLRRVLRQAEASDAGATALGGKLTLNFAVPHAGIYDKRSVDQVVVPGADGVFGVLAGHIPVIAELVPGVVQVIDGDSTEKYFVSSGYASVTADSVCNINAFEAFKLSDLDEAAAKKSLEEANGKLQTAAEGTPQRAEAEIGVQVFSAMVSALQA